MSTRMFILALSCAAACCSATAGSPSSPVIFSFLGTQPGMQHDGGFPMSGVIVGNGGVLYGTTSDEYGVNRGSYGTVYSLSPPAEGSLIWTEQILYAFRGGNDGYLVEGGLALGPSGELYGTTNSGGEANADSGEIFMLTPPANGGDWVETELYSFKGNTSSGTDGCSPLASMLRTNDGSLYGTLSGCGVGGNGGVFQLKPPATGSTNWRYSAIHIFMGVPDGSEPVSGLVRDPSTGALFGTTPQGGTGTCGSPNSGCGTIYELSPPPKGETAWAEQIIYSFQGGTDGAGPTGTLVRDSSGNLWGTTQSTVFELQPPSLGQAAWSKANIFNFTSPATGVGPYAGLTRAASGMLFGTLLGYVGTNGRGFGAVFSLAPPANGGTEWSEKILYPFLNGKTGELPLASMVLSQGYLYGTTEKGGAHSRGTVFRIMAK